MKKKKNKPNGKKPITCLANVKIVPITWLWPGRIPCKLCTLAGNPGQGKSQITIDIAARVTNAKKWPDGKKNKEKGSVLFINCEDDPSDTIKPRFLAAGGDPSKFYLLNFLYDSHGQETSWSFDKGVDEIEVLCNKITDLRLIVIDPVTAYLGNKDGHNASDVRGALNPLMELANNRNITVLLVNHLNKTSGSEAMNRVTGSGAYVAAARVAFIVGPHPDKEDTYCMAVIKTNLSQDKTACEYLIKSRYIKENGSKKVKTSRIEWGDCELLMDANSLLSKPRSDGTASKMEDAIIFLDETLASGPVSEKEVRRYAEEQELSWRTIQRAKKSQGVVSLKSKSKGGSWEWSLPNSQSKPPKPPTV